MLCHCYGQKPPSEHPIGYRLVSKRGFHLQIFCKYKRPIKVTDDAEIDTDIRLYPAYWEYSARNWKITCHMLHLFNISKMFKKETVYWMDHMVFGSMISLGDPYLYHKCLVVLPIPFLSADKSTYEFGFLRRLLNGKKVLRYLARNLFMVKWNPFWERNISKTT